MSECRALTNLVGNAVATIVVAKWTGALDTEQLRLTLARGDVDDISVLDVPEDPQVIRTID